MSVMTAGSVMAAGYVMTVIGAAVVTQLRKGEIRRMTAGSEMTVVTAGSGTTAVRREGLRPGGSCGARDMQMLSA